ncbi:unnamed protein product [Urochloa humidicola]
MHFIQEEVQMEELLGDDNPGPAHGQGFPQDAHLLNMQLGLVQTPSFVLDESLAFRYESQWSPSVLPKLTLPAQWAKHFTPGMNSQHVDIPLFWSDFFTAQLLNPLNFDWAKGFLNSNALKLLDTGDGMIKFSLPAKCPINTPPLCPKATELPETDSVKGKTAIPEGLPAELIPSSSSAPPVFTGVTSPPAPTLLRPSATSPATPLADTIKKVNATPGPWSKTLLEKAGKLKAPVIDELLSEEDLRRSKRMQIQKKGFRKSPCNNDQCIGCAIRPPPTVPPSVIKNLGASFCKVDPGKLTSDALLQKRQAAPPGGKKLIKKKQTKDNDNEDTNKNTKKPKKQ